MDPVLPFLCGLIWLVALFGLVAAWTNEGRDVQRWSTDEKPGHEGRASSTAAP